MWELDETTYELGIERYSRLSNSRHTRTYEANGKPSRPTMRHRSPLSGGSSAAAAMSFAAIATVLASTVMVMS